MSNPTKLKFSLNTFISKGKGKCRGSRRLELKLEAVSLGGHNPWMYYNRHNHIYTKMK